MPLHLKQDSTRGMHLKILNRNGSWNDKSHTNAFLMKKCPMPWAAYQHALLCLLLPFRFCSTEGQPHQHLFSLPNELKKAEACVYWAGRNTPVAKEQPEQASKCLQIIVPPANRELRENLIKFQQSHCHSLQALGGHWMTCIRLWRVWSMPVFKNICYFLLSSCTAGMSSTVLQKALCVKCWPFPARWLCAKNLGWPSAAYFKLKLPASGTEPALSP